MTLGGKKTVLITGCSPGGIGHKLAKAFHSRGLHVFATARNEKALADLTAVGIEALSLEVTSPEAILEVKRHVSERTGGSLDYLVNNAGRNYTVPALDIDFDEVLNVFDTNIISVMRLCQAFGPLIIQAKGTIIQIGSVAADLPYVFGSVYNASKAALHAYSNTLRVELAPFDVKVTVVVTGGVKSNISRTHRELPEGSLYIPLDKEYQRRQLYGQEKAMATEVYAEKVVEAVLQPAPAPWLWKGSQASLVWLVVNFFPRGFLQYYFTKLFKMDKLSKIATDQRKND
ncbi:hypothetical protein JMJ35_002177 [Cladonia borealis]|uniref:NAD(P)-binding protein n=1 Tax=Cladonia borealis TaxID=184061 RepID=A0AA39V3L8_9LECA|nr:hypothetical protein JMJ35_002177 [Cladonia borealis]